MSSEIYFVTLFAWMVGLGGVLPAKVAAWLLDLAFVSVNQIWEAFRSCRPNARTCVRLRHLENIVLAPYK